MRRPLDIAAQLPPRGPARAFVIVSLVVGGVIAVGLTALIVIFMATTLRR